ncbi:MAG: SPASM domain-containing protein [Phycisphaerales bacterium]|nr:SPASM domain-containing protein [Phycisphaerales bacterium]
MNNVTALLSLLHEPADRNSATRLFRSEPVLSWTLSRLERCQLLGSVAILCWEDQLPAVRPIAEQACAYILAKGPRHNIPSMEAIAAGRRWTDGWRGGLAGACDFDLGFHATWVDEVIGQAGSDAVVLVHPAAALVDPMLVDGLIAHAKSHPAVELCFSQAAAGLSGTLLKPALVRKLSAAGVHPGRLLHYQPDHPVRDQISGEECAPVPMRVARTIHHFKLDTDRQIQRITAAMRCFNGQLIRTEAEHLVQQMESTPRVDSLPREVTVELTCRRATRPIYRPSTHLKLDRADMTLDMARRIFDQLAAADDMRLTLAGAGDPLLAGDSMAIVRAAAEAGIKAIHVETDLMGLDVEWVRMLGAVPIDVLSVHLPAITPATYAAMMGIDAIGQVINNVRLLLESRQQHNRGVPLVVPTFIKCRQNLAEMEPWYDQWLKALGSAVIAGPGDYAGQIPNLAVAEMAPPKRRPCFRLNQRMMILSDGSAIACEEDVLGSASLGNVENESVARLWRKLDPMRADHQSGQWGRHSLCANCSQWHRP